MSGTRNPPAQTVYIPLTTYSKSQRFLMQPLQAFLVSGIPQALVMGKILPPVPVPFVRLALPAAAVFANITMADLLGMIFTHPRPITHLEEKYVTTIPYAITFQSAKVLANIVFAFGPVLALTYGFSFIPDVTQSLLSADPYPAIGFAAGGYVVSKVSQAGLSYLTGYKRDSITGAPNVVTRLLDDFDRVRDDLLKSKGEYFFKLKKDGSEDVALLRTSVSLEVGTPLEEDDPVESSSEWAKAGRYLSEQTLRAIATIFAFEALLELKPDESMLRYCIAFMPFILAAITQTHRYLHYAAYSLPMPTVTVEEVNENEATAQDQSSEVPPQFEVTMSETVVEPQQDQRENTALLSESRRESAPKNADWTNDKLARGILASVLLLICAGTIDGLMLVVPTSTSSDKLPEWVSPVSSWNQGQRIGLELLIAFILIALEKTLNCLTANSKQNNQSVVYNPSRLFASQGNSSTDSSPLQQQTRPLTLQAGSSSRSLPFTETHFPRSESPVEGENDSQSEIPLEVENASRQQYYSGSESDDNGLLLIPSEAQKPSKKYSVKNNSLFKVSSEGDTPEEMFQTDEEIAQGNYQAPSRGCFSSRASK